ncbi:MULTISPECIES: hypothetical protein [Achromobacter]|uniref:hypothetical protein n=1 Tax=Achromobacter TaxID=222 RepID=UPI001465F48E|nr:hypothetical protein [Achromobacter dolens]CAB3689882.1 hypothetical protein LMG26840_04755 [Achromobacter dolens]
MRVLLLFLWGLVRPFWVFGLIAAVVVLLSGLAGLRNNYEGSLTLIVGVGVYVFGGGWALFKGLPEHFKESLQHRVNKLKSREGLSPNIEQFSNGCIQYMGVDTKAQKVIFWPYTLRKPWIFSVSDLLRRSEEYKNTAVETRFVLADGRSFVFTLDRDKHTVFDALLKQQIGW